MPPLRIALVDDHPIVRAGFKQLLEMEPGWQVAAELGSARELAAWLLSGTCDVLVMDLSLPDGDGLVLIRHVLAQRPDLAIVVLSMHDGALYVQDALSAGARGYVRAHGVDAAGEGEERLPELTSREAQVFLLIARGHSVARVAATIGVSNKTAYAHRANIYAKLALQSDYQLRLLARRRGLVDHLPG